MKHRRMILWPLVAAACAAPAVRAQDVDLTRTMSSEALRTVFRPLTATASKSTVLIFAEELGATRQVALGTVVSDDGYILTKASEVANQPRLRVALPVAGGRRHYDATIVGVRDAEDLALLKIGASGLIPVIWADTAPPPATTRSATKPAETAPSEAEGAPVREGAVQISVGQWVATVGPDGSSDGSAAADDPIAVGVISVGRRKIDREAGYLGIYFDTRTADRALIGQVTRNSPAEVAGVKSGDAITGIGGKPIRNAAEVRAALLPFRSGESVALTVDRDGRSLSLRPTLGPPLPASVAAEEQYVSGAISRRTNDFPAVFQHDAIIRPAFCGGPIVDLQGRVLGMNIARVSRVETFALPADVIVPLIEPLKAGKYPPPATARRPGG